MDYTNLVDDNGVYLYKDDSFNTISIKLNFLGGRSNIEVVILDLLCGYLMRTNQKYKSDDEINKRRKELYSTQLYFSNSFYGSQKIFSLNADLVSFDAIKDDYSDSAFEFIRNILYCPDFTDEKMLGIVKRKLISNITLDLSDNEILASNLYTQNVLYEEDRKYDSSIDIEYITSIINSITLDDLKKEYEYILSNFQSGLVFGNISSEQFNKFRKYIPLESNNEKLDYSKYVQTKEGNIEIEKDDITQSYIYVTYDIDDLDYARLMTLRYILNSSNGLCHQLLREKYGLVYSCHTGIMYYSKKLYFYAETDKEKKEQFLKAIDELVSVLNNKESLDELLKYAKEKINANEYSLSEEKDRMFDLLDNYILNLFEGYNRNEIINQINNMTGEDLTNTIKTLKKKNVFILRSSNNE